MSIAVRMRSPCAATTSGRERDARCSTCPRSARSGSATCSSRASRRGTTSVTVRAWLAKYSAACPAELPAPMRWTSSPCVRARLAARGAVVDALADQPVEAVDRQPPPRHAGGEDDGPRPHDVAAVEEHLARRRVDARRPSASPGSRRRAAAPAAARGWPARRPRRRWESRGSSRCATMSRPDRPAPRARSPACAGPRTRRTPPRPGRPGPPPMMTVSYSAAARPVCRPSRSASSRSSRPHERRAVGRRGRTGQSPSAGSGARPALGSVRRIGREPVVGDLVAGEEPAQVAAGGVPAVPDHVARGLGGSAAMPCSPPMRSRASAPTFSATSGAAAAMA